MSLVASSLFTSNIIDSKASKSIFYHDIHSQNSFTDTSTHVNLFKDHIKNIRDWWIIRSKTIGLINMSDILDNYISKIDRGGISKKLITIY